MFYCVPATDCPANKDGYGLVIVFSMNAVFQIFVGYYGTTAIRTYNPNPTVQAWQEWKEL